MYNRDFCVSSLFLTIFINSSLQNEHLRMNLQKSATLIHLKLNLWMVIRLQLNYISKESTLVTTKCFFIELQTYSTKIIEFYSPNFLTKISWKQHSYKKLYCKFIWVWRNIFQVRANFYFYFFHTMKYFLPIFSKLFMHFEGGGGEAALMSSGDMVFSEEMPRV